MKLLKVGVLVSIVLLITTSLVVAQPPPDIVPPVTNIVLSADRAVIQKNEYALLTAQIESEYLDDRAITFEIVSGANIADLGQFPPPAETQGDELTVSTNESGVAQVYLIAGDATGTVKVMACWKGGEICSNIVDIDIVEAEYGVKLSTETPVKSVYLDEIAQYIIEIKNTGLHSDSYNINVNCPSEVLCELSKDYVELQSGETDTIVLNASSTSAGNFTITVVATSVSDPTVSDTLTLYLNATARPVGKLPGCGDYPRDVDGDGLYEDVNGNGVADVNDLFVFFNNMDWIVENGYTQYFDFNGNNMIDINDIFTLFLEILS